MTIFCIFVGNTGLLGLLDFGQVLGKKIHVFCLACETIGAESGKREEGITFPANAATASTFMLKLFRKDKVQRITG